MSSTTSSALSEGVRRVLDPVLSTAGPIGVPVRDVTAPLGASIHTPPLPESLHLSTASVLHPNALAIAMVDFGAMLDFPPWTATAFTYTGLILLVLGLMAWLGSHSLYRRGWGRRLAMSGGGLFVVGSAFGSVVDLLRYVLG